MIWNEPVHEGRNLGRWLRLGNFPDGIVEATLEAKSGRIKKEVLKGSLFLVGKGNEDERRKKVGKILRNLHPYMDQADFSLGCQVPLLLKRNQSDEDNIQFRDLFSGTDLLVLEEFGSMFPDECTDLDRQLATRAFTPPRITVLIFPEKAPPQISTTERVFGRRIQRV